jgi:glycosyltransferase involved in cell wall biosynthesis
MFRVLAFTVKPAESADTRYRILQYRDLAERDNIRIEHCSLMSPRYFQWQTRNENIFLRIVLYPILIIVRLWQVLFTAPKYDAVWVLREMAPFGPPVLEQLLVRRCKRVIFDIDDALHIEDRKSARVIPRLLRDRGKFSRMAPLYDAVICGNDYLAEFYSGWCRTVHVVPTVVDAPRYSKVGTIPSEIVRIGWVGTPLNRHHLEVVRGALVQLAQERKFELVIVGLNEPLDWDVAGIRYLKWELEEELNYFAQFDIGVMPLTDSAFARGKCAFKLIQYMAAGLPVVASPVGMNSSVVDNGRNGFLSSTEAEWESALRRLIDDPALRKQMGENGRNLVRSSYSVEGAWPAYAGLLTAVERKGAVCAG